MTMLTHVFDHPNVTGLCPSAIFPLRYSIPPVALWQRTGDWWMVWIFWCGFLRAESDLFVICLEFDASGSLCSYCIFWQTSLNWLKYPWNWSCLVVNFQNYYENMSEAAKHVSQHSHLGITIPVPGWKLKPATNTARNLPEPPLAIST